MQCVDKQDRAALCCSKLLAAAESFLCCNSLHVACLFFHNESVRVMVFYEGIAAITAFSFHP